MFFEEKHNTQGAQTSGVIIKDEIQGLRTPRMHSLLAVNEHFEEKHNAQGAQTLGVIIKDEIQGLRTPRMRSLLAVNEHFEEKHNAEVRLYNHSHPNLGSNYSP